MMRFPWDGPPMALASHLNFSLGGELGSSAACIEKGSGILLFHIGVAEVFLRCDDIAHPLF